MNEPFYMCPESLVAYKSRLQGNIKIAKEIEELVQENIENGIGLYETQTVIKEMLISRYGTEWYARSGDAVNYIIENAYANEERRKNPYFDMKQYREDKRNGVCYMWD